jgi:hypothetical protein
MKCLKGIRSEVPLQHAAQIGIAIPPVHRKMEQSGATNLNFTINRPVRKNAHMLFEEMAARISDQTSDLAGVDHLPQCLSKTYGL